MAEHDESLSFPLDEVPCKVCGTIGSLRRWRRHKVHCIKKECDAKYIEDPHTITCTCGRNFKTWKRGRRFCSTRCRVRTFKRLKVTPLAKSKRRLKKVIETINDEELLERIGTFIVQEVRDALKI